MFKESRTKKQEPRSKSLDSNYRLEIGKNTVYGFLIIYIM